MDYLGLLVRGKDRGWKNCCLYAPMLRDEYDRKLQVEILRMRLRCNLFEGQLNAVRTINPENGWANAGLMRVMVDLLWILVLQLSNY